MNRRNTLKVIHIVGTTWLVVCVAYLLVLTLRQAGFNWWLILVLSGHWALFVILLVSLYLFAVFRGASKGPDIQKEHPLTSTGFYLAFYVSVPLLGILAGAAAMTGETEIAQFLSGIALGTLAATFLTWVIIDPLASALETLVPAARAHRLQRLAEDKRRREEQQQARKELLNRLFAHQEQDRRRWQALLATDAEKLAMLLRANRADFEQAERQAVDIGVRAWQIGGLDCMRWLHDMTVKLFKKRYQNLTITDHISNWWDGIGSWRTPVLG